MESYNNDFDSLKNNSKWGGAREGAGRPAGTENQATKEKKIVEEQFKQRVLRSANELINSQMNLARGVQMLYCVEKDSKGKNKPPRLVTSQYEIEGYLAGDLDNSDDYHFITTERPDNRALDSLFDRVFGKSVSNLDIKSDGKALPTPILPLDAILTNNSNNKDSEPETED